MKLSLVSLAIADTSCPHSAYCLSIVFLVSLCGSLKYTDSWWRFVIVHCSASDKLQLQCSCCLFVDWVFFPQRERKECLANCFQSKVWALVSGKLSKCVHIHSYTHLTTSSVLNKCLLVHNFQNSCSTECHW